MSSRDVFIIHAGKAQSQAVLAAPPFKQCVCARVHACVLVWVCETGRDGRERKGTHVPEGLANRPSARKGKTGRSFETLLLSCP